ncbi:MAG: ABC transporter ATP-binding protein [Bacilli bacterium]
MKKIVVEMDNVVKTYEELVALDHFSLQVFENEIIGLLGPNGSGKSTIINILISLLNYEQGSVKIFGQPMKATSYNIKKDIGIVFQDIAVIDELTVIENIDYFCGLYVKDQTLRKQYVEEALDFVGLQEFKKKLPRQLSGGLLRRLNIACGISHKPKLIFFDEPTVAVDPQSRNKILEQIKALNENGATIIYTSHYMEEIEYLCNRIVIIDHGKLIANGSSYELSKMIDVQEIIKLEVDIPIEKLEELLSDLSSIESIDENDGLFNIRLNKYGNNIESIINILNEANIIYSKIYSIRPTLNDVFLELTGKELRD